MGEYEIHDRYERDDDDSIVPSTHAEGLDRVYCHGLLIPKASADTHEWSHGLRSGGAPPPVWLVDLPGEWGKRIALSRNQLVGDAPDWRDAVSGSLVEYIKTNFDSDLGDLPFDRRFMEMGRLGATFRLQREDMARLLSLDEWPIPVFSEQSMKLTTAGSVVRSGFVSLPGWARDSNVSHELLEKLASLLDFASRREQKQGLVVPGSSVFVHSGGTPLGTFAQYAMSLVYNRIDDEFIPASVIIRQVAADAHPLCQVRWLPKEREWQSVREACESILSDASSEHIEEAAFIARRSYPCLEFLRFEPPYESYLGFGSRMINVAEPDGRALLWATAVVLGHDSGDLAARTLQAQGREALEILGSTGPIFRIGDVDTMSLMARLYESAAQLAGTPSVTFRAASQSRFVPGTM